MLGGGFSVVWRDQPDKIGGGMHTRIIEATQSIKDGPNWGKFCIMRFDDEWRQRSIINPDTQTPLVRQCGWEWGTIFVLDLQTGEGAKFDPVPGGNARADLRRHAIWVCPLFEPFLMWLYTQDTNHLDALPSVVELPTAPFEPWGYRRPGPSLNVGT
jgi:hypothetical protein